MNKVETVVNTHELKEGDVILISHYGVYFQLAQRVVWPMASNKDPVTQGDVITFVGTPVAEYADHRFPRHRMKDYSIQGNKLAKWVKVEAE